MTGKSPSSILPLFYGDGYLQRFGFDPSKAVASLVDSPVRRNLVAPAKETEIYRGFGTSLKQRQATRDMLKRLAACMTSRALPKDPHNERIPAGYTYLAQLAAHDLVHHVAPLPRTDDIASYFARDYRNDRLMLETIYGGGPLASPLAFAIDGYASRQRHHLRLGFVPAKEPESYDRPSPMTDQPARDIGRVACPFLKDAPGLGVPDALIADPRNDDHLIISQLAALFHELHNIVFERLAAGGYLGDFESYRLFVLARNIVAIAYRSIIVDDLLQLMLEGQVYDHYRASTTRYPQDFLDPQSDGRVPLEFSHAAYRLGHAMVRFEYTLNHKRPNNIGKPRVASAEEILERSSSRNPRRMPVACNWLLDWAHFFDLKEADKNVDLSRRFSPSVRGALSSSLHFENEDSAEGGLFYRDLMRGADASLRKVESLIGLLREQDRSRSQLLCDPEFRSGEIKNWLGSCESLSEDEIRCLSADPPLFFFLLFEAEHDQNGERLGILGSVILAEVFFAAYRKGEQSLERDTQLHAKAAAMFGGAIPENMAGLIDFIRKNGGLAEVQC